MDEFVIKDGVLTKYNGKDTVVKIPDSVTSIGEYVFFEKKHIEEVIIPDSVTSIGEYAFCDCINLESVTVPDSVTYIGDKAFNDTPWLKNNPDEMVIAGKVLLKYNKKDEKKVKIPNSVTCIADHAFEYCRFKSITIPNSVTDMTGRAFSSCRSLSNINVNKNNTALCDVDGVLFSKEKDVLIRYPSAKAETAYTIPDSVTSIGCCAFYDCENLESVTIPDSVTNIGDAAFYGCGNLKNVMIPNSVTSIGWGAFEYCSKLESVTVPDSVTYIGDEAFNDTPWLKNNPDEMVIAGKVLLRYNGKERDITISEYITGIGNHAFGTMRKLDSITMYDSVTYVSYWTFLDCKPKTIYIISNGVKYTIDLSIYSEYTFFDKKILAFLDFIKNKHFAAPIKPQTKYSIMLDTMIFADEEAAKPYIKKNFVKIMKWLIDEKDMDRLNTIVENANFITEQNIDTFIDYAEEKKQRKMFNFFTKYKTENFGTAK